MNALLDDFSVHDPVARLWPQTERVKAAVRLMGACEDEIGRQSDLQEALRALSGLDRYLRTSRSGLWYDRLTREGTMIEEPAPASSFYHIACAISELQEAASPLSPG